MAEPDRLAIRRSWWGSWRPITGIIRRQKGFLGGLAGVSPPKSPDRRVRPATRVKRLRHTYRLLVWRPVFIANLPLGPAWWGKVIRIVPYQGVHWHMVDLRALR